MLRRRPLSTLFPYTTLFRSSPLARLKTTWSWWWSWTTSRRRRRRRSRQRTRQRRRRRRRLVVHRSEEHTSELQSLRHLVCRLLLEKKILENGFPYRHSCNAI